jgi:hypothetical protein
MRMEEEVQRALAEAGVREDPKECLFCRELTTNYVTSQIRDQDGIWRSEFRPFCRQSDHRCSTMYDVTQRTKRGRRLRMSPSPKRRRSPTPKRQRSRSPVDDIVDDILVV